MTGEPLCDPGDTILLANGENRKVDSVESEFLDDPATVYNFEVADWHTYFVGNTGVLVHNANIQACSDAAASAGGNGKAAGGAGEGGSGTGEKILPIEKTHDLARNTLVKELDVTGAFKNAPKSIMVD